MKDTLVLKLTTQTNKEIGLDKANLANKATQVAKATFSNKANNGLWVKGLSLEVKGQLKLISHILDLTYAELIELLLANYVEDNPILQDKLSNQTIRFNALPRGEEKLIFRSFDADRIITDTKQLLEKDALSDNALRFRCHDQLLPFLSDRSVPEEQKKEILAFFEFVKSKKGDLIL